MTSKVTGDKKLIANIKAVIGVFDVNSMRFKRAIKLAGRIVEAAAKRKFASLIPLGLTKGGNKIYPSPTLPIDVPHIRTGLLKGSITTSRVKAGSVTVGSNVDYAKYVEPTRPFLRPALFDNKRTIEKFLSKRLKLALKMVIR